MWSSTRMVVLTAMSASLYAAILIPFKVIPIIPGVTELRPANAVPVVCSFLFGPAAGWGAAIGNVIGDFFGGLGPGDVFGCAGNLFYGVAPYRIWRALGGGRPIPTTAGGWLRFAVAVLGGAAGCSLIIGWGLNLLGFVPFAVLGNIVFVNNLLAGGILAPIIVRLLYPRVERARLLHTDVFPTTRPGSVRAALGLVLLFAGASSGMVAGNLASSGRWQPAWVAQSWSASPTRAAQVGFGLLPFVAVASLGLGLLGGRVRVAGQLPGPR